MLDSKVSTAILIFSLLNFSWFWIYFIFQIYNFLLYFLMRLVYFYFKMDSNKILNKGWSLIFHRLPTDKRDCKFIIEILNALIQRQSRSEKSCSTESQDHGLIIWIVTLIILLDKNTKDMDWRFWRVGW